MTQTKLALKDTYKQARYALEFAEEIGLTSDDSRVTIYFYGHTEWGEQARSVNIDRTLAERLTRILNDEFDCRLSEEPPAAAAGPTQ